MDREPAQPDERSRGLITLPAGDSLVTTERIAAIERLIRPYIRTTPILDVRPADFGIEAGRLVFKLESSQYAGSFKVRGAFANLLSRQIPSAGVVAASGGNHGLAVAFAAHRLGIPAKVFVPAIASRAKMDRIRACEADLVIAGDRYADALAASQVAARESGALEIHAYDQIETLVGQGTLGLELEAQAPDVDTVLVAVGGGGLIGGVAAWYRGRTAAGATRVVGVEPESAPTLTRALEAGAPIDSPAGGIAADSLAPRRVGELMFPIARHAVERVVLVSDDAIRDAQMALWTELRTVAEPGGAAAFAALLSRRYVPGPDERIAVVVCGGNTTAVDFTTPA